MWGNYNYHKIPMGFYNIPYIFQENISELFKGFKMVCVYIDSILVITKHDLADHPKSLEIFLQKLAEEGLKINVEKSFFRHIENEYLDFCFFLTG